MKTKNTLKTKAKQNSTQGITLVALVVTIIAMLILAGVTLSLVLGDNGVITRAGNARYMQAKATIEEAIEMDKGYVETYMQTGESNESQYYPQLKTQLETDQAIKSISSNVSATIKSDNLYGEYISLTVGEDFVFKVERDKTTFLGTAEEATTLDVELTASAIGFSYSVNGWTNQNVDVEIAIGDAEYEQYSIEYSYDKETWTAYDSAIPISENTVIYARLTDGFAVTPQYATGEVEWIDKIDPIITSVTTTSNSVTINASDLDAGILAYAITTSSTAPSTESSEWKTPTAGAGTKTLEVTETGYSQNTSYNVFVKDQAGNVATTAESTGSVTGLTTSNITFDYIATYTEENYTQGPVQVKLTVSNETKGDNELRYRIGREGSWKTYTEPFSVDENSLIDAALYDGNNYGAYSTGEINNIDLQAPTNVSLTVNSVTTNSINVTARANDDNGIVSYKFSSNGGTSWSAEQKTTSTSLSYTYSGLTASRSYSLMVQAKDVSGRTTNSSIVTSSTNAAGNQITVGGSTVTLTKSAESLKSHYGKTVTSFSSVSGVSWQLFYDDVNYYYLIAKNCISASLLPSELIAKTNNSYIDYGVAAFENRNTSNIFNTSPWSNGAKSSSILESDKTTYLKWINSYPNSNHRGVKATAYLMDREIWSKFAGSKKGVTATGGPTLEMFVKSYNAKSGHTKMGTYDTINSNNSDQNGYRVSIDGGSSWNNRYGWMPDSYENDDMWCPNGNAAFPDDYWLASPGVSDGLCHVSVLGIGGESIYGANTNDPKGAGIRPLVCIPK